MSKYLITGVSGNVGKSVSKYFEVNNIKYIIGVRNPTKVVSTINSDVRYLDFENQDSFPLALKGVEILFLIRPPQLTDVDSIFKPFIDTCKRSNVKHIVFLSLLGVEKNPFPPHYKIEKIIQKSDINFTFIRPSFFMQNLIQPHGEDIRKFSEIFIPSGNAKISFIDTNDIGEIVGICMTNDIHMNKMYTITGPEAVTYYEVAKQMSKVMNRTITYTNPSLLKFRKTMISRGIKKEFVNVMMLLYLTTKLGLAKQVNNVAEEILGRKPKSIYYFIIENSDLWMNEDKK